MKFKVFSIRDTKAGTYNAPFLQYSAGEAQRTFAKLKSDTNTDVNKFPEDFDLYQLGEFDNETGKYASEESPVHIIKAVNL